MKALSLFSGIGGFDHALRNLGHEIIGACEIDRYARSIYRYNFPEIELHGDVSGINPEFLPDFDILCAGFPCQAFSVAGKRLGFEDTRGTLFFEIARIADKKRPRFLLLENVRGLLSNDKGKTFGAILRTLDEIGYDAQWQICNSKYFLPQSRERVFIVGHLREEPRPKIFPVADGNQFHTEPRKAPPEERQRFSSSVHPAGTVDANYHKGYGTRTMIMTDNTGGNIRQRMQDRKEIWTLGTSPNTAIVEPGPITTCPSDSMNYRVYDSNHMSCTIKSQGGGMGAKSGLYTIPVIQPAKVWNGRGRRFKTDGEPSFTGVQNVPGVLISDGNRYYVRRLTPKECERLQGFPDDFTKQGTDGKVSDTQRYKCIGNAVTVPVVKYILNRIGNA